MEKTGTELGDGGDDKERVRGRNDNPSSVCAGRVTRMSGVSGLVGDGGSEFERPCRLPPRGNSSEMEEIEDEDDGLDEIVEDA